MLLSTVAVTISVLNQRVTATSLAQASTDAVIIAVTTTVAIGSSALVAFSAAVFFSVSAAH